jgi:hypothetical protein
VRGPKIIIHPEKLAAFQHAPLSISEEVGRLEQEHREYEDLLAFLSTAIMPNETEEDPRPDVATSAEEAGTSAPPTEYAKFESIDALHAHAPGLIEQHATGDKHVTMLKDDVRGEVWFVSKNDHHIVPKYTIMGSYGSGTLWAAQPRHQRSRAILPMPGRQVHGADHHLC